MKQIRKGLWWGLLAIVLLICWPIIHGLLQVLADIIYLVAALVVKIILLLVKLSETLLLIILGAVFSVILWVTRGR